jgi:hypothetical protein
LNDVLPSSSTATISPSITVSSGNASRARASVGNRPEKSFGSGLQILAAYPALGPRGTGSAWRTSRSCELRRRPRPARA